MSENENVAKEVSLLKQNANYLIKLILGKQVPPVFLKWTCYFFMAWDTLMTVFYLFIGIGKSLMKMSDKYQDMQNFGYMYALLHLISLFGVILLYRKKLTGFYIFTVANITMLVLIFIFKPTVLITSWEIIAIIFTLIAIGLFALNWNIFDYNVRKKEAINK
jgi:uncharacterized membrane protein